MVVIKVDRRGLLLILGLATRPTALVLAGDMVGAIIVSGIALASRSA